MVMCFAVKLQLPEINYMLSSECIVYRLTVPYMNGEFVNEAEGKSKY